MWGRPNGGKDQMAELKITGMIPVDPDDAPARKPKKAATATTRKAREPRNSTGTPSSSGGSRSNDEEIVDPSEPEFDAKAVEDEVKKRYGLETPLKVTEVKRSRSGVKAHRTGATRR